MYRPDGWNETALMIIGEMKMQGTVDLTRRSLIEEGADAMLMGLEPLIRKIAPNSKLIDILYGEDDD